jgi:low temperature requirement protein LtrA
MDRWTGMPHMLGRWGIPMAFVGWIFDFMIIGAIISIILGIFAIYAYMKVRRKEVRTGSTIAIILGIIMLVSMNWLAGLITLIGGILCYTSK